MAGVPAIPDTAGDLIDVLRRSQIEDLERDLALAESRIDQLERWLVAAGDMDPELGP